MSPYAHSEETPSVISSTPQSTHLATFSPQSPLLETPHLDQDKHPLGHSQLSQGDGVEGEDIEELLDIDHSTSFSYHNENAEEIYDTTSLTSNDIHQDSILSDLAAKQNESLSPFKARPAPSSTTRTGLGPRMTKSAALRAGLNWDEIKPKRTVEENIEREGGGGVSGTPGHKRVGLGITVPSLARPSITPRPTKASLLRLKSDNTTTPSSPSFKSPSKISRGHHRTFSVPVFNGATVASLNSPTILPRQNRTSALRAGGEKGNAGYRDYEKIQQEKAAQKVKEQIAIENKERAKREREERRKSLAIGLTSLDKPSVQVRQNRTSNLRAMGEKGTEGYRDYESIQLDKLAQKEKELQAIENREKAKKERIERRKTQALGGGLAALNEPDLVVRQNKTSAMRANGEKGNEGYRDYEKIQEEKRVKEEMERLAIENKQRAKMEREERRKTLSVMPSSLSKPVITPRPNKTSLLRTNSSKSISSLHSVRSPLSTSHSHSRPSTSHSLTRTISALKVSSADNLSLGESQPKPKPKPKLVGSGCGVKSLGKPSITPRLNRTALLRTPQSKTNSSSSRPTLPTSSSTPSIHRKINSISASTPKSSIDSVVGVSPRPTKASLLRANLGMSNKISPPTPPTATSS
ncbi:hypothetical protein L486_03175 [Kwoniella mangroviensis CBS 10435]|uniref:Uncharacterized protein n=1 Tax=Kwoniella mangroviensis CBS 10435 TaxID=1331196 RepID=A0A1B9IT35_9TREE|nr:hypothetical protein L486_03175 [Kwoniella mangroviensis CBS 10435]